MKCRICGETKNNKVFKAKEMMFGIGETFDYFQCSSCDCLQIRNIPENITKYYPQGYYSYFSSNNENIFVRVLKRIRTLIGVFGGVRINTILGEVIPLPLKVFSYLKVNKDMRIVDVGCGSGLLLKSLESIGFRRLQGIDPFIEESMIFNKNLKIEKISIDEMSGEKDIIMFHHSFEHIEDQRSTLNKVHQALSDKGVCVIRIPTVTSYAWLHYGVNWVQLDAPRHFYLHSLKSMEALASQVGMRVEKVIYDSTDFQFWGSELYAQDTPLLKKNKSAINVRDEFFSKKDIRYFSKHAKELNINNKGDQAIFILRK